MAIQNKDSSLPPMVEVQLLPTRIPAIQRDPLGFLLNNARLHGDFIHYPLGLWEVYQLSHPSLVQHVLQANSRNYSKNTIQYNTLAQITGRGLLTSDGRLWLQQRRLAQPAFHRRRLEGMAGTMTQAAAEMVARWERHAAAGKPLDIDEEMMQVTLEVVGKTLFSLDLRHEAHEMAQATLTMLEYVVHRASNPLALPLSIPTGRNRRVQEALELLDRVIYETIAARRRSGEDTGDVLSMFLQARDEETGAGMPDAQIRDEMMTLIIAGHETVASALTWCWYLLSHHPLVRRRLEEELDRVLGGRLPTVADLPQLPFTRAVFDETLRLYPPAWVITRRAIEADEIGGAKIAANGLIIMSPYVTHRHPAFWPNPLGFDPERFLGEQAGPSSRFAYIPFGGGPRLCIGDGFALMEAPLILATVAQRYRLNLVPGHKVKVDALVTLRPHEGLLMHLEPRQV